MNIAIDPMITLLITWLVISLTLCLAFLRVAARHAPSMEEQLMPAGEPALAREMVCSLEGAKAVCALSWSPLPAPPFHARTATAIPLLLPDLDLSLHAIPHSRPRT
jgi:hypothetical protein